jgi:hypothetical protein
MVSLREILTILALLVGALPAIATAEQWLHYGGDAGGQKYSPLAQINAANVAQLEVAWQYSTGELARRPELQSKWAKVQVNPILLPAAAGGHLMICTPFGRVIALDPATGTERWVHDPDTRVGGYATAEDPQGLKSPASPTVAASLTGPKARRRRQPCVASASSSPPTICA